MEIYRVDVEFGLILLASRGKLTKHVGDFKIFQLLNGREPRTPHPHPHANLVVFFFALPTPVITSSRSDTEDAPLVGTHMRPTRSSMVSAGMVEIFRSGHVLCLSLAAYILLSGAHTHIPALIMLDLTRTVEGATIASINLAIGIGNLLKAAISAWLAGPAMDRIGMHWCAIATMGAVAVLLALLALTTTNTLFGPVLVLLVAVSSFAEQPCFVCLTATHFDVLVSVATTCVASSFSIAGALLPLFLSPLLASAGWQRVLWAVVFSHALLLPLLLLKLRPGPLAVGGSTRVVPGALAVGGSTHSLTTIAARVTTSLSGKAKSSMASPETEAGSHQYGKSPYDTSSNDECGARDAPAHETPPPGSGKPDGVSAEQAMRSGAFWALWLCLFLHLAYGSFLSGQLLTALRTGSHLEVTVGTAIVSVQFLCAVAGKLGSGVLLALPTAALPYARAILFVLAPTALCGSHFLLLDVHMERLLSGDVHGGLVFATSIPRLVAYAVCVGLPFGLVFGTLTCLPARLFGRRDLPRLQSAAYSAILLSTACTSALIGYLHDAFGGYQVPLLVTFAASAMQLLLLLYLQRADAAARAARAAPAPRRDEL